MKFSLPENNLSILNKRRKSSFLLSPKSDRRLSISNFFKKRNSNLFKKKFSKDIAVDKTPISKKIKSLNNYNQRKRTGQFQTIIFNKMSIRKAEKNIKKIIKDISHKIGEEKVGSDFDDDINNKTLPNINLNKIRKSFQMEEERASIKSNEFFNISHDKKLSSPNFNYMNLKFRGSQKNLLIKTSNKSITNYNNEIVKVQINEQNYRKLVKTKILYDSFEDNESDNENEKEGSYLSPNSTFINIFDLLIIISTLIIVIYNPYYISVMKCFCFPIPFLIKYIYLLIDFLFILDLLFGFWRAYYNRKYQLVTKITYIIKHYISTQFILDFIQSIPIFTYINFFKCSKNEIKYCTKYNMDNKQMLLIIFSTFKHLKIYKIINKKLNSIIFKLYEFTNEKYLIENILDISIIFLSAFFGFFSFISVHIFIANQNYPNWIENSNVQDSPIMLLYLYSFYFITTTITTVGYGDMIGSSLTETIFKIILLTVGISLYSWIVSNIGNYVNNESRISIRFNKDEAILEEIRIAYPNMPYKLYNQILHHLESRKLRQKKLDLNLLINSLPYSLRNTVLFAVHQKVITNFKIFKNCQNSDFINQLLMNFIPLFSKKNAILIYENQLIENLVFVKEGILSLEAAIDIETPIKSINEYLHFKFNDIRDNNGESSNQLTSHNVIPSEIDVSPTNKNKNSNELDESSIEKEIGKCEFEGEEFEESNYQFINIINITKNESYGIVYMFLSKPSPLSLRVKSKKAELFLLRKFEAFAISKKFPNIWKKQYKKSYNNMNSIKKRTFKKISDYCQSCGISFQMTEAPKLIQSLSIREILQKAKQKERIKSLKSISSISNIFKDSSVDRSPISSIHNISPIKVNTNCKSFNTEENTGTFAVHMNNLPKEKVNFLTLARGGDKSPTKSNFSSSKLKRLSASSSKGTKTSKNLGLKSFGYQESKFLSSNNNESEKPSLKELIKKESQKKIIFNSNKKLNSPHKKNNYIIKLKKKIKKLKVSKLYYKTLLKKISDKLKEYKKQNNKNFTNELIMTLVHYKNEKEKSKNSDDDNNDTNIDKDINKSTNTNNTNNNTKVINNVIVQNNNNYICSFSDFVSSDSNKSSSSSDRKTDFSIDKINQFNYEGEYINLKELTNGEIVNNEKFMETAFKYIRDLYIKLTNEKQKKTIIQQIMINNNSNKAINSKKSKKLLQFYSENFLDLSSLLSEEEKGIKRKKTKEEIFDSIFSNKKIENTNNTNIFKKGKNNSKLNLYNMNNNLCNYSFKVNIENNQTFMNKEGNSSENLNNYLLGNNNYQNDNNNNNKKVYSPLMPKKSFVTENEYSQKSKKDIFNINDNNSYNKKESNIFNNKKERKILETVNSFNSSSEQKLKRTKIIKKSQNFIDIKNEIFNKDLKKQEKQKNKKKEKVVQDYEYCLIL